LKESFALEQAKMMNTADGCTANHTATITAP
jgi:hypothetical protein